MDTYISPLNYSIFVILYITSFVYLYTKYSEIVGLGVLTVIQIAFTLFFGKELSQIIIMVSMKFGVQLASFTVTLKADMPVKAISMLIHSLRMLIMGTTHYNPIHHALMLEQQI